MARCAPLVGSSAWPPPPARPATAVGSQHRTPECPHRRAVGEDHFQRAGLGQHRVGDDLHPHKRGLLGVASLKLSPPAVLGWKPRQERP
jgi:hypothetical protein